MEEAANTLSARCGLTAMRDVSGGCGVMRFVRGIKLRKQIAKQN